MTASPIDSKPAEPGHADAAAIDASSACASAGDVASPPAKRVRRDYPWRDVYVRDLGVRPIQFDAVTGEPVLVECSFCVHFGREAPPAQPKAVANKDGQPLKTRARTRNVAHWKYPFRTDNMRSHHLQQHPQKWKTYQELLEQAKQEHIAVKMQGSVSDTVSALTGPAELRLAGFFGDAASSSELNSSSVASMPSSSAASLFVVLPSTKNKLGRVVSEKGVTPTHSAALTTTSGFDVLATITTPAIVDVVLTAMADVPEHIELSDSCGPAPSFFAAELDNVSALTAQHAAPVQYTVVMPDATALHRLLPTLRAGLSFSQIASILELAEPSQRLSRGEVSAYSRVLVASNLQRISALLNAAWAYSLRIHVVEPTRSHDPVPLHVSVRVPVNLSYSIDEFHVVTLALRPNVEPLDKETMLPVLCKVLSSLDRKWPTKTLSVSLDGATHCLGSDHGDFVTQQLLPSLDGPQISVFNGRQYIERRVQTAWTAFIAESEDHPSCAFVAALLELLARLRSDGEWVRRHGHCPVVKIHSAASVFHALDWLLMHRDAVPPASTAPQWWWLVACVVLEVWTSCRASVQALATSATRAQTLSASEALRSILKSKCCVTDLDDAMGDHVATAFDEKERVATLTCADNGSTITTWPASDMALCFRTLNVSARRLFDELSVHESAAALILAEREVSRFVLQTVGYVNNDLHDVAASQPPPTTPLDFFSIEPAQVVDLIESHSRRLEAAFPTSFLDLAAREIRELQAAMATDALLRQQLQQLSSTTTSISFADAWAIVPQFPAARALAAGLRTALAPSQQRPLSVRAFSGVENGELPMLTHVDLAVEAHAHALQAERLAHARAVDARDAVACVMESQVI